MNAVTIYIDPKARELKAKLQRLQQEEKELVDLKEQINQDINDFTRLFHEEIGDIVMQVFDLRTQKADLLADEDEQFEAMADQERENFDNAQKKYDEYWQRAHQPKEKKPKAKKKMPKKRENRLKEMYRKACKFCHPDKVHRDKRKLAAKVFAELHTAYERGDVAKVALILKSLEHGKLQSSPFSDNNVDQLRAEIELVKKAIFLVQGEIYELKEIPKYEASQDKPWYKYFQRKKKELYHEITKLKTEIKILKSGNAEIKIRQEEY